MAIRERSAGFVIFHQPKSGKRTYLLLDYGRHWDYPKGHLDNGETDLAAATRELREETGIEQVNLVPDFAHEIGYFFRDKRKGLVRKEVMFFLASVEEKQVRLSHEHTGFAFLPFEDALKRVTYPSAKQLLREAEAHLNRIVEKS
jgi:8-oxo-dGTP pyrophosphatase MutT (NUDIX family)